MKNIWLTCLGLLFPPRCVACGGGLSASEPAGFCPGCYAEIPWWDTTQILPPSLPRGLNSFRAAGLYRGTLRESILRMKFHDTPQLAETLAKLMVPLLPQTGPESLLVPVPMHASALRKRRYNQAALLAFYISRSTHIPTIPDALKRLDPTEAQHNLTKTQRQKLSSKAFKASPQVADKHIILIDDIYTTGATARACAHSLLKGGARKVDALTIAYTPPGHEEPPKQLAPEKF